MASPSFILSQTHIIPSQSRLAALTASPDSSTSPCGRSTNRSATTSSTLTEAPYCCACRNQYRREPQDISPVFERPDPWTTDYINSHLDHSARDRSRLCPAPPYDSVDQDNARGHQPPTVHRRAASPRPRRSKFQEKMVNRFSSDNERDPRVLKVLEMEVVLDDGGVVDMYGPRQTNYSYTISGVVNIKLPSMSRSNRSTVRCINELDLHVESKAEYFDKDGRYTPLRLFRSHLDIFDEDPNAPLDEHLDYPIPDYDVLDPSQPFVIVSMPFTTQIPGWLPATCSSENGKVTHGLVARAVIGWLPWTDEDDVADLVDITRWNNSSRWKTLGPPGHGSTPGPQLGRERISFVAERNLDMTSTHTSLTPFTSFEIRRHNLPSAFNSFFTDEQLVAHNIPDQGSVLSINVSAPEWVDRNSDKALKLVIRVRANMRHVEDLYQEAQIAQDIDPNDTYVTIRDIAMSGLEVTKYSSTRLASSHRDPLPVGESQAQPYLSVPTRHSDRDLTSPVDLALQPATGTHCRRVLLAEDGAERNYRFPNRGLAIGHNYRKINVLLPIPQVSASNLPNPDIETPFFELHNQINVTFRCVVKGLQGGVACRFTVPVKFGTSPATAPRAVPKISPYLPAYTQIYVNIRVDVGDTQPITAPNLRPREPVPLYVANKEDDPNYINEDRWSWEDVHCTCDGLWDLPDYDRSTSMSELTVRVSRCSTHPAYEVALLRNARPHQHGDPVPLAFFPVASASTLGPAPIAAAAAGGSAMSSFRRIEEIGESPSAPSVPITTPTPVPETVNRPPAVPVPAPVPLVAAASNPTLSAIVSSRPVSPASLDSPANPTTPTLPLANPDMPSQVRMGRTDSASSSSSQTFPKTSAGTGLPSQTIQAAKRS